MLVKGNKIIQVKEIPGFNYVGTEFEVDGFTDMKVQFHGAMGQGVMTLAEFEEYFQKVVAPPPEPRRVWTEWRYIDLVGDSFVERRHGVTNFKYRTNGKKVQVAMNIYNQSKVRIATQSSCSPSDSFDLDKGLNLCALRMKLAILLSEM